MRILGEISALGVPIGTISPRGFRFNQHRGAGMSVQARIDQTFLKVNNQLYRSLYTCPPYFIKRPTCGVFPHGPAIGFATKQHLCGCARRGKHIVFGDHNEPTLDPKYTVSNQLLAPSRKRRSPDGGRVFARARRALQDHKSLWSIETTPNASLPTTIELLVFLLRLVFAGLLKNRIAQRGEKNTGIVMQIFAVGFQGFGYMGALTGILIDQRIAACSFSVPDAEPFEKQRVGLSEAVRAGYDD